MARSFLSQSIAKKVTKRAAKVKPGKVVQMKRLWKGSVLMSWSWRLISWSGCTVIKPKTSTPK